MIGVLVQRFGQHYNGFENSPDNGIRSINRSFSQIFFFCEILKVYPKLFARLDFEQVNHGIRNPQARITKPQHGTFNRIDKAAIFGQNHKSAGTERGYAQGGSAFLAAISSNIGVKPGCVMAKLSTAVSPSPRSHRTTAGRGVTGFFFSQNMA